MLNAIDYEAKHRRLQNLRHVGTGEWLYRQAEYIDWGIPDKSASLRCHGIRGYYCVFSRAKYLRFC